MKIDNKDMEIKRVEVITKVYDSVGRPIKEQWEFYFPKDTALKPIGFRETKKQK